MKTFSSLKNCLIYLDEQLKQSYSLLENQCTQLYNANQAWQQFYANQIDLLRCKFGDYIDLENNLDFEQIIESLAAKLGQDIQVKKHNLSSKYITIITLYLNL